MMTHARYSPPDDPKRLWVKAIQLGQVQRQLKYVDYAQAQHDCELLAERLLAAYSRAELNDFSFVAIPRGGLIVLGLLAYALNLNPGRLIQPAPDSAGPLCIVDDCALTGVRFARSLSQRPNEHVAFAHLYSHPDLRKSILDKEPRVRCCVAAQDLDAFRWDAPPDPAGGSHAPPSALGSHRYWSGSVAPVAFAWSEPVINVLDPFTREIETHWRFTPPHLCLKNKAELGLPPDPATARSWRCPAPVVMGQAGEVMWVIRTDTAKTYTFEGIEADMWRALAGYGSVEAARAYVESRHGAGDGSIREDFDRFVGYLAAEGLIEPG